MPSFKFLVLVCTTLAVIGCAAQGPSAVEDSRGADVRPAQQGKDIHMSSAGVGYGGYARIALWMLNNLLQQDPAMNLWVDLHTTGKRFRDGLLVLADGKAEISLVNSQGLAMMALKGKGLFERPIPLRGIGNLGSGEWTVFAVDAKHGIKTFADLKERKLPLKILTGYLDDSAIGFLLLDLMKRHGIEPEEFKSWGGEFIQGSPGDFARGQLASGNADAVFQESIIGDEVNALLRKRPMNFLSVEPDVAKAMAEEYGWPFVTVPANTYPGQPEPFVQPDFADWLICVRDDMDEDLAYKLAQIVVEKREDLDTKKAYGSLTFSPFGPRAPELSTVTKFLIPLHPGAERYYREKGMLPK
jgi:uncharacterized protein